MSARQFYHVTSDLVDHARRLMKPGNATNTGMSLREAAAYLKIHPELLDAALWRNLGRRI